jgi:hypothetical protein
VHLMNQVHRSLYLPRGCETVGTATSPFIQKKTNTPGDIVAYNGLYKLPIAATNEVEVNTLYMGDVYPFRVADILSVSIVAGWSASSTHMTGEFGLVTAQNDTQTSMNGILFTVASTGVVTMQCKDGSGVSLTALATGITLTTTPREFVLDFRNGVALADARNSGSYGGYRCIQASCSDTSGILAPIGRTGSILDLNALSASRLQLIAQLRKTSSTTTGYLLFGAAVEWRWQNPAS